ncbi:type II toxin-antitoxin system RelE/ParE family toxin [Aequorivita sp. F47161]|uniref:Type II toxin-antitoxin system RelE/ParE family toxin n=1 Tax=Aequorivita vitellina TaxID=2874475 RepID=A0A9X1QTE5_9FLAO|nr:type II toxin-antitoxin system RelE/ParE family toxin [Aequorivita vitellina]MCG2418405.1 type II toxin-antitoxin system RelE/ParE family toxin [Aequorivita vitellina]MCZ4318489.1 type II toxin-antitoxin system RelE/ParE family toxin [Aequorivita viscosa]
MYQLRIRNIAHEDANEIFDYYGNIDSTLAIRFLNSLYSELDAIAENPELFQNKYKNIRVRYLQKFPFGIHYRIVDKEIIEILSFIHTSRDPKIWKKRNS